MTTNTIDAPESLLAAGVESSRKGQWEDAQASLQAVLNKVPDHAEAMWRLGMAKFFNGDFESGAELIELSLTLNSNCAPAHNGLGVIFQETDELSKAESHFRQAATIEPEDADFLFNLGVVLLRRGNSADAVRTLKSAATYEPNDSDTYLHLGVALKRSNEPAEAETSLRNAVTLDDKNGDAYRELAELWREQGRMNRAYGASLKSVKHDGENPATRLAHGRILFDLGGLQDAISEFETASKVAPEDSEILTYLGRCYLGLGQIEKAITNFESAMRHAADDRETIDRYLSQARARLRPQWQLLLLGDDQRNTAYQAALDAGVSEDDIVLIVGEGTGSGLLAMMAARAGAKKVICCEPDPTTCASVETIISKNKLSEKITIVPTASNFLELGQELEHPATVILADILDSSLLGDGVLKAIRHAVDYLSVENVKVIPASASVYGQLIEWPSERNAQSLKDVNGFDLRELQPFQNPYATHQFHPQYETFRELSEPFEIAQIEFSKLATKTRQKRRSIRASASGDGHAVIVWFELQLNKDTVFSAKSGVSRNRWHSTAHMLTEDLAVQAGREFELILGHSDDRVIVALPGGTEPTQPPGLNTLQSV
jgi:type III protein arginine methyltransferase